MIRPILAAFRRISLRLSSLVREVTPEAENAIMWDRMLSNFPPLQFRRWADLKKDENQDEAHTSTIAIAMKTATKWHLFLRQKI